MVVFVFALTLGLGVVFLGAALAVAFRFQRAEFPKIFGDLTLRLAIVTFGVSLALLGFFGQKWIEDDNDQIQQLTESLGNLDEIQSEYMQEIEKGYYNNENDFIQIVNLCMPEYRKDPDFMDRCNTGAPATLPAAPKDLDAAADYFDFEAEDSILSSFADRFYAQSYIKRNAEPFSIQRIFFSLGKAQERFKIIRDELRDARKAAVTFADQGGADASPAGQARALVYQRRLCCSALTIYQDSERLARLGDDQAGNFCAVREQLGHSLQARISRLETLLAKSRLDQIAATLAYYKANGRECTYVRQPVEPDKPVAIDPPALPQ